MTESADFVMYWWDRAAELLTRKKTPLRRFGLVTTNSISQVFQRRVMERHLDAKAPVSLILAVPDHPWTKATKDSAAVRIAMTVARAGAHEGVLREVAGEAGLDTDDPRLAFEAREGKINADLTVGVNITSALPLTSNRGLCGRGVQLMGGGFILTREEVDLFGLSKSPVVRRYMNGRDVTDRSRGVSVTDFFGINAAIARSDYPEEYQHLLENVHPERQLNRRDSYRERWWQFGENSVSTRDAMSGLGRYIVTVRTAKHRIFSFLSGDVVPDAKLIVVGSDDPLLLAHMSSRIHCSWSFHRGALLEDRPTYHHSECFYPFPFPDPTDAIRTTLRALGEELDATRKTVQAEHPDLTLTGLYNVLEKVRAGTPLDAKDEDVKDRGRVLILKDLHDQIDRATMQAYGWDDLLSPLPVGEGLSAREREARSAARKGEGRVPDGGFAASTDDPHPALRATFSQREKDAQLDEIILERLVALNAERAAEEAAGHVRWLRPDYQIPRFAKGAAAPKSGELDLQDTVVAIDKGLPAFPKDKGEQVMAIRAVLVASGRPMDAAAVSRAFKRGGKGIEQRVVQALNTLVRYAEITPLPNGTFAAKRAA
ncbi:hypothetical protein [Brevundimonas sp. TWP2-3-2]|uniref:hypothetical protein n=1 Tax=unclassified Brevundimonas TaxID=2622653 RepID=UPI003CE6E52D